MEKEKLYIILTKTGTLFSKAIRVYTREEYNHVSISFDEDLSTMYSMSRGSHYNPFSACLKLESPYHSFLKYFEETKCLVLALEVTPEVKEGIRNTLNLLLSKRPRYNIAGVFLYAVGVSIERENHYFCSEFVDILLKMNGVQFFDKESGLVKPEDFRKLTQLEIHYEGYLRDYTYLNGEERLLYDTRVCGRHEQVKRIFSQGFVWFSGR